MRPLDCALLLTLYRGHFPQKVPLRLSRGDGSLWSRGRDVYRRFRWLLRCRLTPFDRMSMRTRPIQALRLLFRRLCLCPFLIHMFETSADISRSFDPGRKRVRSCPLCCISLAVIPGALYVYLNPSHISIRCLQYSLHQRVRYFAAFVHPLRSYIRCVRTSAAFVGIGR